MAREIIGESQCLEIFCDCSLEVCEERDVKGYYAKARAGIIKKYTGISSPYEGPQSPDLVVPTDSISLEVSVDMVLEIVEANL